MLALLAGCETSTFVGSDCSENKEATFDLETPSATPAIELKIESCRVDVDACGALCVRVMQDNNISSSTGLGGGDIPDFGGPQTPVNPFTKCEVTFDSSTTHVTIGYQEFTGGDNCPVF